MIDVRRVLPGSPFPLGASWDGSGTNFAIYSEHATRVELCLFDPNDHTVERLRLRLPATTGPVWHGYVSGVGPGSIYGFRVDGPYRTDDGHRFNPAKLLLDPYARAITGGIEWNTPVYGYRRGHEGGDVKPDGRDDAAGVPKSLVIDPAFDWADDRRPLTPWNQTIIYETHVKGLTKLHPDVPEPLRGTYAGFAHPAVLDHLTRLGVTAVELLPVQAFIDDDFLVRMGLRQYWGYNTVGYFAPEGRYSASGDRGGQVTEFKSMVKALHAAGIEVLLDVVYNHTGEAGRLGPTIGFRGIDNRVYYRLLQRDPAIYEDVTGTGNTVNLAHPQVLKLVMDSLRYWVEEMHVDGFRFDLAPALAREETGFNHAAAFFGAVHQDPVLSTVKLIAEPWDLGEGGYRLGGFPGNWREWNDRFRDTVRRFWKGDRAMLGDLGFRLTGSADILHASRRGPHHSVNFVTAHDGYTLRDLVSYERKHNFDNGELNRDGSDYNHSANYGVEGKTDDPTIRTTRLRQIKNLLATVLLSHGVPMIVAGDELGRTQTGNNNAYCQDNELSWINWDFGCEGRELLAFAARAIAFRGSSVALAQDAYFGGARVPRTRLRDIVWFRPDGNQMTLDDWADPERRVIAYRLVAPSPAERAALEQLFIALNASRERVRFTTPRGGTGPGQRWILELTSAEDLVCAQMRAGGKVELPERSFAVFRLGSRAETEP